MKRFVLMLILLAPSPRVFAEDPPPPPAPDPHVPRCCINCIPECRLLPTEVPPATLIRTESPSQPPMWDWAWLFGGYPY